MTSRWIDVALALLAVAVVANSVALIVGADERWLSIASNVCAALAIGAICMRRIVAAATDDSPIGNWMSALTLEWVLSTLALPYADHPEYDERWRP